MENLSTYSDSKVRAAVKCTGSMFHLIPAAMKGRVTWCQEVERPLLQYHLGA